MLAKNYDPTVAWLKDIIANDKTFGVVSLGPYDHALASVGTTVEIFEYCEVDNNNRMKIKGKGGQRFRLLDFNRNNSM